MEQWRPESGYQAVQSTKPQSLAYGLTDSPAGLAAWIVEKLRAWSDCGGDVERAFTKDELLTNIMIYWVTGSTGSSMRLYYESSREGWQLGFGERIEAPCGVANFPAEVVLPPREWVERLYDVKRWSVLPRGGHFPALEEPAAGGRHPRLLPSTAWQGQPMRRVWSWPEVQGAQSARHGHSRS